MSDYSKLKVLAKAALRLPWGPNWNNPHSHRFLIAANPEVVLGLIAHLDLAVEARDLYMADKKKLAFALNDARTEAAAIKAECEGLRATLTDCSDSLHSEMLGKFGCQMPDDMHPVTRREYDRDMAEVAGYRAVLEKESGQ